MTAPGLSSSGQSQCAAGGATQIRFFGLRDAYRSIENPDGTTTTVTDLPTTIVTIAVKGRAKRVEDYVGAPDSLGEFELRPGTRAPGQR